MTTPVDSPATTNMADDEDAQPEVLLPCAVCGRKFNPRSLDKHFKICERTAAKKRKPFDSARQRIKGTELAEFLPKQQQHHHHHEPTGIGGPAASGHPKEPARSTHHHHRQTPSGPEHDTARARKSNQAWKQTRDEFLRAIRAARGDVPAPSQSQQHSSSSAGCSPPERQQHHHGNGPASSSQAPQQRPSTLSLVSASGPPQRSNEKGQCPTCQRQFGVKSYERHVAFCKERATRLPASPQTSNNVAKERLDARMKYRAPALKNRRPTNREKYSPGGAQKVMLASPLLGKASVKDSSTSMTMKNAETATPKLPILKRPSQASKESPTSNSGPLKSRPMDRSNSGVGEDYNPFLLAEQQLNDLFSDTSDQSSTDGSAICPPKKPNSSPAFPLSHSSAFVKYPNSANSHLPSQSQSQNQHQQQQQQSSTEPKQQQRISLIAPPTGFDDLTSSDLSSDCTETNSLSRELLTSSSAGSRSHQNEGRELGRRLIIDQSQALGGGEFAPAIEQQSKQNGGSRLARPLANRSNSMRSASAPKPPERKISSSSSSGSSDLSRPSKPNDLPGQQRANNNNYKNGLNGSNLSLSSIISSTDLEMKRSNSLFDELLSSFEDDVNSSSTLPSLMSLMRSDHSVSILSSTPQQNGCHQRQPAHGRINCSDDDAELSSPESVKRQECGGKLSADSAYSSLNRKYSTHNGRSANDVSNGNQHSKLKLSKFCHECGCKFPDSAKFCCECGVKRLTI